MVSRQNMRYFLASSVYGGLFFFVAKAGSNNAVSFFELPDNKSSELIVYTIDSVASLTSAFFYFKMLDNSTFTPKDKHAWRLLLLAPFAASAFFAGALEGALGFVSTIPATSIALVLFLFRIMSCIDGSVKFPARVAEIWNDLQRAYRESNRKEMARLILTILTSIGYSAALTDSVFSAIKALLMLLHTPEMASNVLAGIAAILGALGILPMVTYWTHRGLRQLTFGGIPDEKGEVADITDRYTLMSMPLLLTATVGPLGSATGTKGDVFGKLGLFAKGVRVFSSFTYAISASTPSVAGFFRRWCGSPPASEPQQAPPPDYVNLPAEITVNPPHPAAPKGSIV